MNNENNGKNLEGKTFEGKTKKDELRTTLRSYISAKKLNRLNTTSRINKIENIKSKLEKEMGGSISIDKIVQILGGDKNGDKNRDN
jgi:hypothetical protein